MSDSPSPALIKQCVHCGFCLPTCPTYQLWGEEMDSPRGRIYLMKAGVEGRAPMSTGYVRHFDSCLGCLACVTACPSGVQYGPLIEQTRAHIEQSYERGAGDRLFRAALMSVLPYPGRMRVALAPLALLRSVRQILGGSKKQDPPYGGQRALGGSSEQGRSRRAGLQARQQAEGGAEDRRTSPALSQPKAPGSAPSLVARLHAAFSLAPPVTVRALFASGAAHTPASAPERLKVAILTGCVQRLAFGKVNAATVRVLAAEGCRVDAPSAQGCCGALPLHAGCIDQARALARHNIEVFERAGVDRVVVNAAGCGSAMKEYGELLAGDPAWASRARALGAKVRDVSELLVELGEPRAPRQPITARVAYHDACHLAHGQGVRAQPRALLQAIPGIELVTPAEAEICCGSAGIYNLLQPEPAAQLGARKVWHLAALSPDMIATGNPGCTLQIAVSARKVGYNWPVFHPIELIDASIRGARPDGIDE